MSYPSREKPKPLPLAGNNLKERDINGTTLAHS